MHMSQRHIIARVDGREPDTTPSDVGAALDRDAGAAADGVQLADEAGSLITEYFLLAIVAATIASLALKWAAGGAVWELFAAVFDRVRVLLGA